MRVCVPACVRVWDCLDVQFQIRCLERPEKEIFEQRHEGGEVSHVSHREEDNSRAKEQVPRSCGVSVPGRFEE